MANSQHSLELCVKKSIFDSSIVHTNTSEFDSANNSTHKQRNSSIANKTFEFEVEQSFTLKSLCADVLVCMFLILSFSVEFIRNQNF